MYVLNSVLGVVCELLGHAGTRGEANTRQDFVCEVNGVGVKKRLYIKERERMTLASDDSCVYVIKNRVNVTRLDVVK